MMIMGLYFYRARRAVIGPGMDLSASGCRPDPDFDKLTLGLCRPGFRSKAARLAEGSRPVDLLFYTHGDDKSFLMLVALLRVEAAYPSHLSAKASLSDPLPANLIVPGNRCLLGTALDPDTGPIDIDSLPGECICDRHVSRATSVYLRFSAEPGAIRRRNPVILPLHKLAQLAPHGIGSRWPCGIDFEMFQRATQNGAHWLRHSSDVEALRRYFFDSERIKPNSA